MQEFQLVPVRSFLTVCFIFEVKYDGCWKTSCYAYLFLQIINISVTLSHDEKEWFDRMKHHFFYIAFSFIKRSLTNALAQAMYKLFEGVFKFYAEKFLTIINNSYHFLVLFLGARGHCGDIISLSMNVQALNIKTKA